MPQSSSNDLPLEGIRILELGQVQVLPAALTPLAGLGADVIKIESPSRPDQIRQGPQPDNIHRDKSYNHGGNFLQMNRNKRGLALDLSKPRGREVLLRLVATSDVVAENFTTRVLSNLGLEYPVLREANPNIILFSSNGFGHSGPWQNYKAYGPNIEAVDGLMRLTGYLDGIPQRAGSGGLGVTFPDVAGAYFGAYAILAALERRERTGQGEWLDFSHYEGGVATTPESIMAWTMNHELLQPIGNREPGRAPQGVYRCSGLDRWVAISVASDDEFKALAKVLGLPELASRPEYATVEGRWACHDELDALISRATENRDALEVERALQAAGVEAAMVQHSKDVMLDPQLQYRGAFQMAPPPASAPDIGKRPGYRPGWLMKNSPALTRMRPPEFGEHTLEILTNDLGMTADEIAELEAEGIISDRPKDMVSKELIDHATGVETGKFREIDPDYRALLEAQF